MAFARINSIYKKRKNETPLFKINDEDVEKILKINFESLVFICLQKYSSKKSK